MQLLTGERARMYEPCDLSGRNKNSTVDALHEDAPDLERQTWIRRGSKDLLQTQQHQNLAAFGESLECFADEGAGTMKLDAAQVYRLRLHRHSGNVAGDEQITNLDWTTRGIYLEPDSSGRGHQHFVVAPFAQREARLLRDNPRDARVISFRRGLYMIGLGRIECHNCAGQKRVTGQGPTRLRPGI